MFLQKRLYLAPTFGLLALTLAGCKAKIRELELIAPEGTQVQYQLDGSTAASVTLSGNAGNLLPIQRVPVQAEAEVLSITITHPELRERGAPQLKLTLTNGASQDYFTPARSETHLRLKDGREIADVTCGNLIQTSAHNGSLRINITPPVSVGDCDDESLRQHDPRWSGKPRGVGNGSNFYSATEEYGMGEEFVREFNSKNRSHLVWDSQAQPYLQRLMERIAAVSDSPQVKPRVHLINADVVNAFALPGGAVYVFRGLIDQARDENELIGVLGHEWAHVSARHGTRNITRAVKVQAGALVAAVVLELAIQSKKKDEDSTKRSVTSRLLEEHSFETMVALTSVVGQGIILHGSREQEAEADRLGSQYAYRIGFLPNGIGKFFANLGPDSSSGLMNLLSDHPDHESRVRENESEIAAFYPNDALTLPATTHSFLGLREALRSLPPMVVGKEANQMLGLQFVEMSRGLAEKQVRKALGSQVNR